MKKIALITGVNGQDGSYLAEFLLEKNYQVVGLIKNKHSGQAHFTSHIQDHITWLVGNLTEPDSIYAAIKNTKPDEIYNLASQSYPGESWNIALETARTNGIGAHFLFEAVKQLHPTCRIYQASSSEMFGQPLETPQNEQTPFNPVNPYAAAKLYAHHMAQIYRKSYQLFISSGILFNHESPRRGMHFIAQKITYAAACLKLGITQSPLLNEQNEPIVNQGKLLIGNLEAKRDWGYAKEYVEAMWLMLQHHEPDDFVIGTGEIRSIRDLCETAFSYVGLDWKNHIAIDPRFIRLTETGPTVADATKARKILGWRPKKPFDSIIKELVDHHLQDLSS